MASMALMGFSMGFSMGFNGFLMEFSMGFFGGLILEMSRSQIPGSPHLVHVASSRLLCFHGSSSSV